jgi:hypothetical protein
MKHCMIAGCTRHAVARGWCHTHYKRWQRGGDPLTTRRETQGAARRCCAVAGCAGRPYLRGYCGTHYRRVLRTGSPLPTVTAPSHCCIPNCSGKHLARGYCKKHYRAMQRVLAALGASVVGLDTGRIEPSRRGRPRLRSSS